MDKAMNLIRSASAGELESFLQTNPLTPETAEQVREIFISLRDQGRFDEAEFVGAVSANVWLRVGEKVKALQSRIDSLQITFMKAETTEAYAETREASLKAMELARSIEAGRQEFTAAVLAADSCFFGSECDGGEKIFPTPLLLADVKRAALLAAGRSEDSWFVKFASLFGAAVGKGMSRYPGEKERPAIENTLRELAELADQVIPTDFEFPDDANKTSQLASVLTQLADRYGG